MPNKIDITGQKFGLLTAIRYLHTRKKNGNALWFFKCECGNTAKIEASRFNQEKVKSCGCLLNKRVSTKKIKTELIDFIKRKKRTPNFNEMQNKKIFSLGYSRTRRRLGSLRSFIINNNLKLDKIARKYTFNYNYFDHITSDSKAYFLGLIATDGSVRPSPHNQCILRLHKKDKEILIKFKKEIKTTAPIKLLPSNKASIRREDQCSLGLGDRHFVDNLKKYGLIGNKTFNLKFPNLKLLKKNFLSGFIRGIFDGDGTIHKDHGIVSFVSGSKSFLEGIQKSLILSDINNLKLIKVSNYNHYLLTINGSAYKIRKGWFNNNDSVSKRLTLSNTLKFYRFIYKDMKKNLCLIRKKKIMENILIKRNKSRLNFKNLKNISLKRFGL